MNLANDKKVLLKLPYAELQVCELQHELKERNIEFSKKMLKAELYEHLRLSLEHRQDPATLIMLREKEIKAIPTFKKKALTAKL